MGSGILAKIFGIGPMFAVCLHNFIYVLAGQECWSISCWMFTIYVSLFAIPIFMIITGLSCIYVMFELSKFCKAYKSRFKRCFGTNTTCQVHHLFRNRWSCWKCPVSCFTCIRSSYDGSSLHCVSAQADSVILIVNCLLVLFMHRNISKVRKRVRRVGDFKFTRNAPTAVEHTLHQTPTKLNQAEASSGETLGQA